MTFFNTVGHLVGAADMEIGNIAAYHRMDADATFWHRGQTRDISGVEYDSHPTWVRAFIRRLHVKNVVVNGVARLHDIIEETDAYIGEDGRKDRSSRAWNMYVRFQRTFNDPVSHLAVVLAVFTLSKPEAQADKDDKSRFRKYLKQIKEWSNGQVPSWWRSWMAKRGIQLSEEELLRLGDLVWKAVTLGKCGDMVHNFLDNMEKFPEAKISGKVEECKAFCEIFSEPFASILTDDDMAMERARADLIVILDGIIRSFQDGRGMIFAKAPHPRCLKRLKFPMVRRREGLAL